MYDLMNVEIIGGGKDLHQIRSWEAGTRLEVDRGL